MVTLVLIFLSIDVKVALTDGFLLIFGDWDCLGIEDPTTCNYKHPKRFRIFLQLSKRTLNH